MSYQVAGVDVLVVSIVVFFVGSFLTEKIAFLKRNNIPAAVTGGLLCSLLVAGVSAWGHYDIAFDMRIRDVLLLVFFSTIGLDAKFKMLLEGGKSLVVLLLIAGVFLVIQDLTGVGLALAMGAHPGYGLMGGSISFAGGHGTAIAWGQVAQEAGLSGAQEVGIGCATFGLIAGGMIGGPIAGRLIAKHKLTVPSEDRESVVLREDDALTRPASLHGIFGTILLLVTCVEAGDLVNRLLFSRGVMLPGFLTAMLVGIVMTNLADLVGLKLSRRAISVSGEFSLQLFLSMSLMSMQLLTLARAAGPLLLVLAVQVTVITVFASLIVFRLMGRNYDSAVICGGFVGLGLGATPVAIANMSAVTSRFGPSAKAFLVIPLVGAFFIDIVNAMVIKLFVGLPIMQRAVETVGG